MFYFCITNIIKRYDVVMDKDKSSKTKRISLFAAGGLIVAAALLYWVCDISGVFASCLAAAGLCFWGAGLTANTEKKG